jgi:hypothetical protein
MVKTIFLLLFMLNMLQVKSQNPCNFDRAKRQIEQLKKQHEAAMPGKEFIKLFELKIENDGKGHDRIMNTQNVIKFTFMGNTIFRHYVYSDGVDARVLLKQRTGGFFEKQEEITLLDVVKKGNDKSVSYYDYEFFEHNDFLLTFFPVNSSKGCAILISYQITDIDRDEY